LSDHLLFPSDEVSSAALAIKWLEKNAHDESLILVSANVSFNQPPDAAGFEGLKLLKEILLKGIPRARLILYGLDSVKTISAHGGKGLFGPGHEKLFNYVKLPNRNQQPA